MTPARMVSGIAIVDKPPKMTSHDVVGRARRTLRTREIGHAGTLDPMATGLLVLGVGEGTKLLTFLAADTKTYETTVRLGESTTSLDADGAASGEAPVPDDVLAELAGGGGTRLAEALADERARRAQVPPAVSAIHVDGERAHALVRRGVAVDLPPREVRVHALEVLAVRPIPAEIDLRVTADKGYYVRALARDLAAGLGTLGHLVRLRRTRSGAFGLGDAVPLDALSDARLLPLADAARRALPWVSLEPPFDTMARHGKRLPPEIVAGAGEGPAAWFDAAGNLVAVGIRAEDGTGKVVRGFGGR